MGELEQLERMQRLYPKQCKPLPPLADQEIQNMIKVSDFIRRLSKLDDLKNISKEYHREY